MYVLMVLIFTNNVFAPLDVIPVMMFDTEAKCQAVLEARQRVVQQHARSSNSRAVCEKVQ